MAEARQVEAFACELGGLGELVDQARHLPGHAAMPRPVEGGEPRHGRAVEIGAGRGDDAGGEGRGVEFVVGRQDQRGTDQGRVCGRHMPGRSQLLVDGACRDRFAGHGGGKQAQDARASLQHGAAILDPARMVPARGRRQEHETSIDRRQSGGCGPGGAQGGRHRRQVLGVERPVVALPQQLGDLLERRAARQPRGVVSAIVQAAVLDQGQGRFEHRRSEIERAGGDRLGFSSDGAATLQAGDIVGAIAPLAASRRAFGAQKAATDIGVEGGGRHAQPARRLGRADPFAAHEIYY